MIGDSRLPHPGKLGNSHTRQRIEDPTAETPRFEAPADTKTKRRHLDHTIRAYTHLFPAAYAADSHQRAKDSRRQHVGQPRASAIIQAATSRPDREYSPRPGQHSPAADGSRATSSVKLVSPAAPPGREDDTKTPNKTRSCNTRKIRPPHTCTSNTSIRPAPCSASMANGPSST